MDPTRELSRRERQIMQIVFSQGKATAKEIVELLEDPPSRTAIRTILTILVDKGHLKFEREGREFVYFPASSKEKAGRGALRSVLDTFFSGSLENLIATHFSDPKSSVDPQSLKRIEKLEKVRMRKSMEIYQPEETRYGYLMARMQDVGRLEMNEILKSVNEWTNANLDPSLIKIEPAGSDLLIDKNNEYLVSEMFNSFMLALFLIMLLFTYLFRNLRIVVIALMVNAFPLLLTAGLIGYAGMVLNGSTAMIFTIGFVIAVDDTIHFLSRYRLERKVDLKGAVERTQEQVIQPITITSIILAVGYLVPVFSTVREAMYQGILIGSTLIFALLSDLILLPALLNLKLVKK